jgi:hypothetical protein
MSACLIAITRQKMMRNVIAAWALCIAAALTKQMDMTGGKTRRSRLLCLQRPAPVSAETNTLWKKCATGYPTQRARLEKAMASKQLKVYRSSQLSGPDGNQWEMIAAVASKAEFARLLNCSSRYVTEYCSETGNAEQIAVAMAKPHTLFGRHNQNCWYTNITEWQELKRGGSDGK